MSDVVIRAESLGKRYVIGHQAPSGRYRTLRDTIGATLDNFARSARDMAAGRQLVAGDTTEEFWALKGVSFDIERGEVVGIIGRNGAGKSTLLKILSRITEPTEGRVTIKGRVASLLEVGTGFHPELTGRENIYLNGAILGMTHAEIKRKFDEIIDFAEVENFLDTPVKRYSSGMYVRLAFAVAAHLEPQILVVDEVLAVGDAEFQKKCLGKMRDVACRGRTVLFVSHNMHAVRKLCPTTIFLSKGRGSLRKPTNDAITDYTNSSLDHPITHWADHGKFDNPYFTPTRFELVDGETIEIDGVFRQHPQNLAVAIYVENSEGTRIFETTHRDVCDDVPVDYANKHITFRITIPTAFLNVGHYRIPLMVFLHNDKYIVGPNDGPFLTFTIEAPMAGSVLSGGRREGVLLPIIRWHTINRDDPCIAQ